MADVKTINQTAINHTATVTTPDYTANPTVNAITASQIITDSTAIVSNPIYTTSLPVDSANVNVSNPSIDIPSNIDKLEVVVNTQNLGEENIPDHVDYYRFIEFTNITLGQIKLNLIKTFGSEDLITSTHIITKFIDKLFIDHILLSESHIVNIQKILIDSVDATDDFYGLANIDDDQTASFNKVLVDYLLGLSDSQLFEFSKGIRDQTDLTEQAIKNAQKALSTNLVGLYDQSILIADFVRQFSNSSIVSDTSLIDISKLVEDSASLTDYISNSVQSNKLDIVNTSDVLVSTLLYSRFFSDSIDATDDFYGLANVDDDQIAAFSKVLATSTNLSNSDDFTTQSNFIRIFTGTDNSYITDILTKNLSNQYLDSALASEITNKEIDSSILISLSSNDQQYKSYIKSLLEIFNTADNNSIVVNKVLLNTTNNISETAIVSFNKVLFDSILSQDLLQLNIVKSLGTENIYSLEESTKLFQKQLETSLTQVADNQIDKHNQKLLLDVFSLADLHLTSVNKFILNTLYTADAQTRLIEKILVDQISIQDLVDFAKERTDYYYDQAQATDDFYGLANIDDDQIATFNKVLASPVSGITDYVVSQIQPNKVDNVATTESRSAHIQDYFLEEYVLHTQRYVGTTVTI